MTLDVLRGIQGIGPAALIPASVRVLLTSTFARPDLGRPPTSLEFLRRHSPLDLYDLSHFPLSPLVPQWGESFVTFRVVSLHS